MSVGSLLPEVSGRVRLRSSRRYKEKSSGLIPYINTSKSAILIIRQYPVRSPSPLLFRHCSHRTREFPALAGGEGESHPPFVWVHLHNRNCASLPVLLVYRALRIPTASYEPEVDAPNACFAHRFCPIARHQDIPAENKPDAGS